MKLRTLFWILAISAASLLWAIISLAAPPPIYPGEPGSDSKFPAVRFADAGINTVCSVTWFYDGGHRWIRAGFYGTNSDCVNAKQQVIDRIGIDPALMPNFVLSGYVGWKMLQIPHAVKDELWNSIFTVKPGDKDYTDLFNADLPAQALWESIPMPTDAPPSGWVTQTTETFKQTQLIGAYKLTKLTAEDLPTGQPCNTAVSVSDATGVYHALVDKTKVVMKKVGQYTPPVPSTVYARCVP